MIVDLVFEEAQPQMAARDLDAGSIHLWRLPYTLAMGRAPLFTLLGAYLDVPATSVTLLEGWHGKPHLASAWPHCDVRSLLEFNWSHSGDYALIALAYGDALGVDVERFGRRRRTLELARRFFDPQEADALSALDPRALDRAFIGLWCAKEAVLKATGRGLAFGLARLRFLRHNDGRWGLARVDPALGNAAGWQVVAFTAAPGYHGTLAWQGGPRKIVTFRTAAGTQSE